MPFQISAPWQHPCYTMRPGEIRVMVTMVLLLHPSYFYPGLATPAWQRPVCGHLWQERDITGNYN